MAVCAGGRPGRARSPAVGNPPRHPDCRGRSRRSTAPELARRVRNHLHAAAARSLPAGLRTRAHARDEPGRGRSPALRSFSSAAITSPCSASGSMRHFARGSPGARWPAPVGPCRLPPRAAGGARSVGQFLDGAAPAAPSPAAFRAGAVPARRFPLRALPPRGPRGLFCRYCVSSCAICAAGPARLPGGPPGRAVRTWRHSTGPIIRLARPAGRP